MIDYQSDVHFLVVYHLLLLLVLNGNKFPRDDIDIGVDHHEYLYSNSMEELYKDYVHHFEVFHIPISRKENNVFLYKETIPSTLSLLLIKIDLN